MNLHPHIITPRQKQQKENLQTTWTAHICVFIEFFITAVLLLSWEKRWALKKTNILAVFMVLQE